MRHLTAAELPLVRLLFERAHLSIDPELQLVVPMNDGNMGSLAFAPICRSRSFGRVASEFVFNDRDGVSVTATLNLDREDLPFELDLFKGDFSALQQWPDSTQLTVIARAQQ